MLIITFYKLCLCCHGIEAVKKKAFEINLLENSPVNVKVKEEKCEIGEDEITPHALLSKAEAETD